MASNGAQQITGRKRELAALDRALATLERGSGATVALLGEPGIGKSRLLAELCARAEDRS
ncbi:MAG: ATP-binding protein, partial [Gaiellales bacterium]